MKQILFIFNQTAQVMAQITSYNISFVFLPFLILFARSFWLFEFVSPLSYYLNFELYVYFYFMQILERLGIPEASSMLDGTHFVADQFVRTRNLLEAMARGKPIVTPAWLERCNLSSQFVDEKNFILRDAKKEKEIRFSMPNSLATACHNPLLKVPFALPCTQSTQSTQRGTHMYTS